MEAKELLNKWVEEIDKPWIKNKVTFLLLGARGEFETIRCIIGFKEPEADEIDRLKEICNSRIDRLEPFTSDLITFISISVGSLLLSLSILINAGILKQEANGFFGRYFPSVFWFFQGNGWTGMRILMSVLFILTILFLFQVCRFKAQANAWYAIKEGLSLVKKDKKDCENVDP